MHTLNNKILINVHYNMNKCANVMVNMMIIMHFFTTNQSLIEHKIISKHNFMS